MKKFKVTWSDCITGISTSLVVRAESLESAKAEELKIVERIQKLSPQISLLSVEVA